MARARDERLADARARTASCAVQFGGPVLELLDPRARRPPPRPAQRSGPTCSTTTRRSRVAVERARARSRATRPIGEVLLDQTVAAGIGNVVRCEALYALRIDPWAPLGGHLATRR